MAGSVSANRGGGKKPGALVRIIVELTANGAEVTKEYEPGKDKQGFPMYSTTSAKDKMSFSDKEAAAEYVEEILTGKKENEADEV
jgi:hypothetical protein